MIVDTDILIDLQRKHPPAISWFASLDTVPNVPGFVVMELIQGCKHKEALLTVKRLLDPFEIVWADHSECELGLGFFSRFYLSHHLGMIDSLIACIAVGRNVELCTFNEKHYRGPSRD